MKNKLDIEKIKENWKFKSEQERQEWYERLERRNKLLKWFEEKEDKGIKIDILEPEIQIMIEEFYLRKKMREGLVIKGIKIRE